MATPGADTYGGMRGRSIGSSSNRHADFRARASSGTFRRRRPATTASAAAAGSMYSMAAASRLAGRRPGIDSLTGGAGRDTSSWNFGDRPDLIGTSSPLRPGAATATARGTGPDQWRLSRRPWTDGQLRSETGGRGGPVFWLPPLRRARQALLRHRDGRSTSSPTTTPTRREARVARHLANGARLATSDFRFV